MSIGLLKRHFERALRERATQRHFRSHPIAHDFSVYTPDDAKLGFQVEYARAAAVDDADALFARMDSTADGLTDAEAELRRGREGANEIEHDRPLPAWRRLWLAYRSPFSLLLTVLALISWLTQDFKAATVIALMVVLATGIRFYEESKSSRAADSLKALVRNTATVLRRRAGDEGKTSAPHEYPTRELVRGDVILLAAGDMIPADCRVLS
jgi:Mg2+-importing ATPase